MFCSIWCMSGSASQWSRRCWSIPAVSRYSIVICRGVVNHLTVSYWFIWLFCAFCDLHVMLNCISSSVVVFLLFFCHYCCIFYSPEIIRITRFQYSIFLPHDAVLACICDGSVSVCTSKGLLKVTASHVHCYHAWARGTPFPPLLIPCPFTYSSLALYYFFPFSFSHPLYLFSFIVHPIPFYQNSPTPFPGVRS